MLPIVQIDLGQGPSPEEFKANWETMVGSFKAFFVDFPPPFDGTGTQPVRDKQVEAILSWYQELSKKG